MVKSRFLLAIFAVAVAVSASGCSYYQSVVIKMKAIDGAKAFQDKKLDKAEGFFREAVAIDPEFTSDESKLVAKLLANLLQRKFIGGNKVDKATGMEALGLYEKIVSWNPADEKSFEALHGLSRDLKPNERLALLQKRAVNSNVPNQFRSKAYIWLTVDQFECAKEALGGDEGSTGPAKKGAAPKTPTVAKDLDRLKSCTEKGLGYIEEGVKLVSAVSLDGLSNQEKIDILRINVNSLGFKVNLLNMSVNIADIEKNAETKKSLEATIEKIKAERKGLEQKRDKLEEEEARRREAEGNKKK